MTNNVFTLTIPNFLSRSKEETNQLVGRMKMQKNNRNETLDIYRLAKKVSDGYSFHACKHDLAYYEVGQKKASIRNKSFQSTKIFAADVDHGNFTLSEVKKMMNSCEIKLKPAMIYETQSSREGHRRYRVVFISNRLVESSEEFSKVQSYLMYVFAKDNYKNFKVDVTCKDACRIFYTARKGGVIEVNDVTIDTDKILKFCDKVDIENVRKNLKKQVDNLFEVYEPKKFEKTIRKKNSSVPVLLHEEEMSDELEELIINNIMGLRSNHNYPSEIDMFSGIELINQLPLTEILGWNLNEMNSCVFHTDTNPSAHIISNGFTEVYKCFSCQDDMSEVYNVFEVLHRLFSKKHNHSYYDTQNLILSLMEIDLGTPYQRNASKQLDFNLLTLHKWEDHRFQTTSHESLVKYLNRAGLFVLLKQMTELAKYNLSMEPVCKGEDEKCATFFASCRYLQHKMKKYRGFSTTEYVNKKINRLCKLGLIEKIDKTEIREKFQARTDAQCNSIAERLNEQRFKIALQQGKALDLDSALMDSKYIKDIDYYRVKFLSESVVQEALERIASDKKYGVKQKAFTKKQIEAVYEDLVDKVIRNNVIPITRGEKHLIKVCDNLIDGYIAEKGYFTEEDLLDNIDKSRNYFKKKASKQRALDQFLPMLVKEKDLTIQKVNKENRALFNIPETIKSRSKIYTK